MNLQGLLLLVGLTIVVGSPIACLVVCYQILAEVKIVRGRIDDLENALYEDDGDPDDPKEEHEAAAPNIVHLMGRRAA